ATSSGAHPDEVGVAAPIFIGALPKAEDDTEG
ncbi:MAG: hypothetical protein UZ07_CHB004002711, partial [Chlorobi bacterium OLB7]